MVQLMIIIIKYGKFDDISIRRNFEKSRNFSLPLATRIVKERKKRCMNLRGKQKKEVYDFERKTNGSTAALMSGKKKFVEKKTRFLGNFGFPVILQKIF